MLWRARVYYYPTGSGPLGTELSNVQQVSVFCGRQKLTDSYGSSRATITVRYPTGYVTPLTDLKPSVRVVIRAQTIETVPKSFNLYDGFISDVSVQYGMPYAGGVGPADFLTIDCEGGLARLARATGNGYGMAAATLETQLDNAQTQSKVNLFEPATIKNTPIGGATVDGSWADWLNQVVSTIAGRLADVGGVNVFGQSPAAYVTTPFTDAGNGMTYNQIEFDSLADNYYTQVVIDPVSYAEVIKSNVPTGEAPRTYVVNTYSSSDQQAVDLGSFLLSQFDNPELGIAQFSVNLDGLNGYEQQFRDVMMSVVGSNAVGVQVPVVFRGTTYNCVIEGYNFTGTPGSQSMTFYVSDNSLNNFLVLDNPVFGQLNNNKLGFI